MAKPLILALETSSGQCSVALDGAIQAQLSEPAARSHAARLLPMAEQLLAEQGLVFADLDAIAFARGPGAFTGVRIAAATAQGLAFALQKPIVPISTLAALAWQAIAQGRTQVVSLLDARMGQCYWGHYAACPELGLQPVQEDALSQPESVVAKAELILGEGAQLQQLMPEQMRALPFVSATPEAWAVAALALRQPALWLDDPALALPQYLRDQVVHQ